MMNMMQPQPNIWGPTAMPAPQAQAMPMQGLAAAPAPAQGEGGLGKQLGGALMSKGVTMAANAILPGSGAIAGMLGGAK